MDTVARSSFAVAATPLFAAFGDALTFERSGDGARFGYAGQSVVVEVADGSLDARFLSAPTIEAIVGTVGAASYRTRPHGYALTPAGCANMVADVVAFFSGTREPRFAFVDVVCDDR